MLQPSGGEKSGLEPLGYFAASLDAHATFVGLIVAAARVNAVSRTPNWYIDYVQAPSPLLDKNTLERLERLAIRWEHSFNGLLGGQNVSRYPGVGHEFLDHRNFQQGDDFRAVNWRAYLRLERIFLKMFRTEPRTPVRLFLDTSESMACGASGNGPGESKFEFACRLAAALCYVGLVRLETIQVQPFASVLGENYRAEGGRHMYARASGFIENLSSGGRSDFTKCVRQFLTGSPAPGMVVLLSDFLDESGCETALSHLGDYGNELLLIQVAGPEDRAPSWRGELELVDAESGELKRINVDSETAEQYTAAYDEFRGKLEFVARRSQGRYVHLTTDVEMAETLYGALIGSGAVSLQ